MCPVEEESSRGGFAQLDQEGRKEVALAAYGVTDMGGQMYRGRRLMPEPEVQEFLRSHRVAHVGTVGL